MQRSSAPRTALVVAHPDDEALWFSSVLADVDRIIICFSEIASFPAWTAGRRKAFARYPLAGLSVLGLREAEVFNGADWSAPRPTSYGMAVRRSPAALPGFSEARYRSNFPVLHARLVALLAGVTRVYTHNPWGEYGHEEHVQVYAAVKAAQAELGFEIAWSNYVSNKSYAFMLARLAAYGAQYAVRPIRNDMAHDLLRLYRESGCWTWYPDYVWPASECMVVERGGNELPGRVLPLNLVTVEPPPAAEKTRFWSRWARGMEKAARRLSTSGG